MFRKICISLMVLAAAFCLVSCGSSRTGSAEGESAQIGETGETASAPAEETGADTETAAEPQRILIAYFSRAGENYNVGVVEKGNTEIIAEMIAAQTGGDLFKIETVETYPETYEECTEVAKQEQRDNARPELVSNLENLDDYDVIFLGYPIWWGDMPMAVYTFLESQDFSGKTLLPFCTNEGSGLASTVSAIAEETGAEIKDSFEIRGSVAQNSQAEAETAVKSWVEENLPAAASMENS